jgi:hypothetical protein
MKITGFIFILTLLFTLVFSSCSARSEYLSPSAGNPDITFNYGVVTPSTASQKDPSSPPIWLYLVLAIGVIFILGVIAIAYFLSKSKPAWERIDVNIDRLKIQQLWEAPYNRNVFDRTERKLLRRIKSGDGHVHGVLFGCGSQGFFPFFDVLVVFAYNDVINNLNIAVADTGDAPIQVYWDNKPITLTPTDEVLQDKVFYDNVPALIRAKWLSFNVRNVQLP